MLEDTERVVRKLMVRLLAKVDPNRSYKAEEVHTLFDNAFEEVSRDERVRDELIVNLDRERNRLPPLGTHSAQNSPCDRASTRARRIPPQND